MELRPVQGEEKFEAHRSCHYGIFGLEKCSHNGAARAMFFVAANVACLHHWVRWPALVGILTTTWYQNQAYPLMNLQKSSLMFGWRMMWCRHHSKRWFYLKSESFKTMFPHWGNMSTSTGKHKNSLFFESSDVHVWGGLSGDTPYLGQTTKICQLMTGNIVSRILTHGHNLNFIRDLIWSTPGSRLQTYRMW